MQKTRDQIVQEAAQRVIEAEMGRLSVQLLVARTENDALREELAALKTEAMKAKVAKSPEQADNTAEPPGAAALRAVSH